MSSNLEKNKEQAKQALQRTLDMVEGMDAHCFQDFNLYFSWKEVLSPQWMSTTAYKGGGGTGSPPKPLPPI